jgi:hypothetical protein
MIIILMLYVMYICIDLKILLSATSPAKLLRNYRLDNMPNYKLKIVIRLLLVVLLTYLSENLIIKALLLMMGVLDLYIYYRYSQM